MDINLIIQKEQHSLFRYTCYKIGNADEAADLLQEVFLRIYSNSANLENVNNVQNYLYRSISNACNSYYRRNAQKNLVSIDKAKNLAEETDTDFKDEFQRIGQILSTIPEDQAEVIRLRVICDKSFVDIANILMLPVTTVQSRFKYGIGKIRNNFFNHK